MLVNNKLESFKLVIKPGDQSLRSSDYWAVLGLCALGAFVLMMVVGSTI